MFEAVLFDLDGTLADTAPDLGESANLLLAEEGHAAKPLAMLRPYTSQGVRGLLKAMPWTGSLFAIGLLALIGLPPFGLFISEFALFRAGFAGHHPWLMGAALVLLTVGFVAFINHLNRMLYGSPPENMTNGIHNGWRIVPLLPGIAILALLGIALPAPLTTLLDQIIAIVTRT